MRNFVVFFSVSLLFVGCTLKTAQERGLPVIDLSQNSRPKIEEQFMELVKYIPLETRDDVLIDRRRRLVYFSDERIVIVNSRLGDFFVFDGNGKIISTFNRLGPGPEDYPRMSLHTAVAFDGQNKEIFVLDRGLAQVYHEDGRHLRSFHFPSRMLINEAFCFDEKSLLVYNGNTNTDSAFIFMSKKDGAILSIIDVPFENRISNYLELSGRRVLLGVPQKPLLKDGDRFILSDMSSDTIYVLSKDKQLTPLAVRTPSVHEYGEDRPFRVFQPLKAGERFIVGYYFQHDLHQQDLTALQQPDATMVVYDMITQQTFDFNAISDAYLRGYSVNDVGAYLPSAIYVTSSFPDVILRDFEDGKLEGFPIKNIASKLDGEDNPVLEVVRIK